MGTQKKNALIVDVGAGTGAFAHAIAEVHPEAKVIGVDLAPEMVARAQMKYSRPNLEYKHAAAGTTFTKGADAAFYSSIFHEVYSYEGDSMEAVYQALRVAHENLATGGRVIIRDFVRLSNGKRRVILTHSRADMRAGHTFMDFARDFGRSVPARIVKNSETSISYETDLATAYEFMFRKDYHDNWDAELKEHYGFWTSEGAKQLIERAGFKVVESNPPSTINGHSS